MKRSETQRTLACGACLKELAHYDPSIPGDYERARESNAWQHNCDEQKRIQRRLLRAQQEAAPRRATP